MRVLRDGGGQAAAPVGGRAWPDNTQRQAAPVRRVPEGPEGTGGLRGAATNEVRPPSLAGGRAIRRPQHQRGNKQQVGEPGCGARGRRWDRPGNTQRQDAPSEARGADGSRAGRAAAEDLLGQQTTSRKTAAHRHTKQPGPKAGPDGARNTSDTTHNTRTTARVRQRGGYRSTRPLSAHSATASSRLKAG